MLHVSTLDHDTILEMNMFDICVRLCPLFCNRNFSTMVWLQSILNSTLPLTVYVHTNNTTHSYARLFTTRIHCTYVGNTYMIMVVALTCILYNIRTHSHTTTHLPPTRQPTPYPYTQTHTHTSKYRHTEHYDIH